MKVTERQRAIAQIARRLDLLHMKTEWLVEQLTELGIGNCGSREELIERLHRQIWLQAYD